MTTLLFEGDYEQAYRIMERMCIDGTVENSNVDTDTKNTTNGSPENLNILIPKQAGLALKDVPQLIIEENKEAGFVYFYLSF